MLLQIKGCWLMNFINNLVKLKLHDTSTYVPSNCIVFFVFLTKHNYSLFLWCNTDRYAIWININYASMNMLIIENNELYRGVKDCHFYFSSYPINNVCMFMSIKINMFLYYGRGLFILPTINSAPLYKPWSVSDKSTYIEQFVQFPHQ